MLTQKGKMAQNGRKWQARMTKRKGDKETGRNGTLCGISRFATVMALTSGNEL